MEASCEDFNTAVNRPFVCSDLLYEWSGIGPIWSGRYTLKRKISHVEEIHKHSDRWENPVPLRGIFYQ